ncbi:MAG: hypothetical protein AAGA18_14665 [Verrucomicrobiota bacterium]
MAQLTNITFLITRISLGIVGLAICLIVLFPEYVGKGEAREWEVQRVVNLLIGLNMLIVSAVLFIKPLQVWLMRSFAFRAMSSMSIILLLLAQVTLAVAGISVTAVVLSADWLGLDPTPGFGLTRSLQLAAGLSLLAATYLLHSKPLQRWVVKSFGEKILGHLQFIVLLFTKYALLLTGLATVFLASCAELIGIDTSPGWGHARTLQFCVGLSFTAVAIILQSRAMKAWFVRHSGLRLLSPVQITVMLIVRVILAVSGVSVTVLVISADWIGLDPTPGWGRDRFMQLIAGLALLFATFILHNRSLWKWMRRS